MTKARTEGARRRQKVASRVLAVAWAECALSGVRIAAEQGKRPKGRKNGAMCPMEYNAVLARRCAVMGWDPTEANLAAVRDQRYGTLYGRLAMASRLGKSPETNRDAYLGLAEYDRLTRQYRRICLGATVPGDAEGPPRVDDGDPRDLADRWMAAYGSLASQGARIADAVAFILGAHPDTPPSAVSVADAAAVTLGGLQLARHFGLRE